jgi:formylglycine-generating enzyme required for sulfatase activity
MTHQVRRGGTWVFRTLLSNGRSTYRSIWPSRELPDDYTGFRVVCLPLEVAPPRIVLRGGCSQYHSWFFRSTYRGFYWPVHANERAGFRVVCLPREVAP